MAQVTRPLVTRGQRYAASGVGVGPARIVLLLLLLIPVAAFWFLTSGSTPRLGSASASSTPAPSFDPKTLFQEESRRFLPPPVAAIPAEKGAGPPAPAASDPAQTTPVERVKVANTGGLGAVLRAEPPRGRQVGALRDGNVLQVLERQDVNGEEWLRVKTQEGAEGWIYGRLVGPAN